MSITFPLNINRSQRVSDLANQIAFIQDDAVDKESSMDMLGTVEVNALTRIAERAGAASLEEYVDRLMEVMPPDVKAEYEETKSDLAEMNEAFKWTYLADLAIAAFGKRIWKLSEPVLRKVFRNVNTNFVFRMFNKASAAYVKGVNALGASIGRVATKVADRLFRGVPVLRKFMRFIGNNLAKLWGPGTVLGVLLFIGIIAVDAGLGAKHRKELRDLINEAASMRFYAKKLDMQFELVRGLSGAMAGVAQGINIYDELLADEIITQEKYDEKMDTLLEEIAGPLRDGIDEIDDDAVLAACHHLDEISGSWTDEDPDIDSINQWIDENMPADLDETSTSAESDPPSNVLMEPLPSIKPVKPVLRSDDIITTTQVNVTQVRRGNIQFAMLGQMVEANRTLSTVKSF